MKYLCKTCKSENVQAQAWVNLNDHTKIDFSLSENTEPFSYWCPACDEHVSVDIVPDNWNDGFLETYFEIVTYIFANMDKDPLLKNIYENQGRRGMYEHAKRLTERFEDLHKNRLWDGEFYDELEKFFNTQSIK